MIGVGIVSGGATVATGAGVAVVVMVTFGVIDTMPCAALTWPSATPRLWVSTAFCRMSWLMV